MTLSLKPCRADVSPSRDTSGMTDAPDVIAQLTTMLAEAEAREDRAGAAWARYALDRAEQAAAQMDAIEALILALIPTRERGALTALLIEERMQRLTATVGASVKEAKRVAEQMTAEDEQRRRQRSVSTEAGQRD